MVSAMRTPSSSSSATSSLVPVVVTDVRTKSHTDGVGLDFDTLLRMSTLGHIRNLVVQDFCLAERVHKGGSSSSRSPYRKDAIFQVDEAFLLAEDDKRDVPTTMRVNWTPFLGCFPLFLAV